MAEIRRPDVGDWAEKRALDAASKLATSLHTLAWLDEPLPEHIVRTTAEFFATALREAEGRSKETGAVEWGLAFEEGRDSILARLNAPDEAMVEAMRVYAMEYEEHPRDMLRALASVLSTERQTQEGE